MAPLGKTRNPPMRRLKFLALILTCGLLLPTALLSSGGAAAQEALVCYYDARGNQHDADSCKIGQDLSRSGSTQLRSRCQRSSGAYCDVGTSGQCRPGAYKYSQFRVFDRATNQNCPPRLRSAGGGGPEVVAPTCPAGFFLSGSQCMRAAAPAPAPRPSCKQAFRTCMEAAAQILHPRENFEMEQQCKSNLNACSGGGRPAACKAEPGCPCVNGRQVCH